MKELIELLKPVVEQVLFEQEVQEICANAQISLDKSKNLSIHRVRRKGVAHEQKRELRHSS